MTRARPRSTTFLRVVAAALFALGATSFVPSAATAQNLFAPVAKVNEDVITGYDVMQRAALLKFAGMRGVDDFERTALNQLVEDSLKLQEAERRGLTMSDADLDKAIEDVARNNRMSLDALMSQLKQAGVETATLRKQVRADVLWRQIVQSRYGERLQPTEGEVEAAMSDAVAPSGPKLYDVKQLVLPLQPNAPLPTVKATFEKAIQVRAQLKSCEQLIQMAPKFSPISGNVGVIPAEQMPGPIREKVTKLSVNGVTEPMRSRDGVHLIMLCGVQAGGGAKASRSQVFNRLIQEKGQRFSESFIAELRRDALIESRK